MSVAESKIKDVCYVNVSVSASVEAEHGCASNSLPSVFSVVSASALGRAKSAQFVAMK